MNILILGNSSDEHARHIKQALTEADVQVNYFDTRRFPTQWEMSWQPNTEVGSLQLSEQHQIDFQDIKSVYWRSFNGVEIPNLAESYQQMLAFNDSMSALRTILQACPARWVNSWQAYQFHKEKPLQLRQVNQLGVRIPDTLITNNPEQVNSFAQSHSQVIFKPVYGGAHTQILTAAHLETDRLKLALSISPITIQEYIPGTNIRSYVIGDSVYSAEIRSNSLDFRADNRAELIPLELPAQIKQQCLAITKALYLEWTAIDWRRNPEGEYYFLEANPSPMFIHFEKQTGFPITEKLIELLIS